MKKKIAGCMIRIAEYAAKKAVSKASPWDHFQPRESEAVRNWAMKTKN